MRHTTLVLLAVALACVSRLAVAEPEITSMSRPIRRLLQRGTTQMLPGTFGAGNSASTGNPGGGTTGSGTTGNSAFGTGSAGTFGGGSTDTTAWGTGTTGAFSGGSTMGGQTTGGSTISGQNTGTFGGGAIGSTTDAASGGSTTSGGGYPYIIATLKAAKRGDTKARNNLLALQYLWIGCGGESRNENPDDEAAILAGVDQIPAFVEAGVVDTWKQILIDALDKVHSNPPTAAECDKFFAGDTGRRLLQFTGLRK